MIYVVDASVAIKWYIPENFEQEAGAILAGDHDLHAPELILPEFSNILWKKVRRGEIDQDEAESILDAFSLTRLHFHSHLEFIRSAFAGANETGQTVYDWTYLALAISLAGKFVTADERFFNAIEPTNFRSSIAWLGSV